MPVLCVIWQMCCPSQGLPLCGTSVSTSWATLGDGGGHPLLPLHHWSASNILLPLSVMVHGRGLAEEIQAIQAEMMESLQERAKVTFSLL